MVYLQFVINWYCQSLIVLCLVLASFMCWSLSDPLTCHFSNYL